MAAKHSRHVALTAPLTTFIDRQLTDGRYATASEVVRAALRLLAEREDARLALNAGAGAGPNDGLTHD